MLVIESPDFELTDPIKEHCKTCFEKVFERYPAVNTTLHLHQDGNGFKLSWNYVIPGHNPFVIKGEGPDLYGLVKSSSSRLMRTLSKAN
jgi:ribosome-associated translation inhibitor RaiA